MFPFIFFLSESERNSQGWANPNPEALNSKSPMCKAEVHIPEPSSTVPHGKHNRELKSEDNQDKKVASLITNVGVPKELLATEPKEHVQFHFPPAI